MTDRSILRTRVRPHHKSDRRDETIVEVVRDGVTVATIYGSREGIHVVSKLLGRPENTFFPFQVRGGDPGAVLPLLRADEECPWCSGKDPQCLVCGPPGP